MDQASSAGVSTQDQFVALKELIFRHTGLDLNRYKENYLKRRIAARMRALGIEAYGAYASYLEAAPKEFEKLIDRVTVNVTEFFRDPDVYEEIETQLPEISAVRKGKDKPVLVAWCAGCSSGEEPYSLAMLFEKARRTGEGLDYSILATDLDEACLEKARKAIYPAAAAQKLDPWYRSHCLEEAGEGLRVKEEIRRRVCVEKHNLFSDPPPTSLDLVLCRNVMIYFSRELQQRLLDSFHKALRPGGRFITGKTETILGPARQFYRCLSARARIFERL